MQNSGQLNDNYLKIFFTIYGPLATPTVSHTHLSVNPTVYVTSGHVPDIHHRISGRVLIKSEGIREGSEDGRVVV